MRVHVLQLAYGDDESVPERVARVCDLVRGQSGADLVVLPELWAPGGFAYRTWAGCAEPVDGPTVQAVAAAARDVGAVVHAGSLIESGQGGAEGRNLWNTSVVLGPDGGVLATYRKVHRFGFGAGEPRLLEAGGEVVAVPLPLPEPVQTGLSTCYDLRFPELYRLLGERGAELVLVPAAWPASRVEHWRLLGRARALENQCVVVQCNTAGTHAGTEMGGHSQVVGPQGEVLGRAGTGEEVLVVDVDLAEVADVRGRFPVLADRRL